MPVNSALLATYALTVLLLIASPGPVVALVVNTTARAGRKQALLTALGTNGASLVLIALAAALIFSSAAVNPLLLSALSMFGCLFIGYLGLGALAELRQPALAIQQAPVRQGGLWQGFAIGLSNPKDILFFVAFFPQFIQVTEQFSQSLMVLGLVWLVLDLGILGLYILVIGRLAERLNRRLISAISAVVLLAIAVAGLAYNLRQLLP
ncbi:Leucine efflux protein [compost metagenome]|jgi:threonine/homoserine/homoserine lactone efflux protein|uniref:LysE type translocator family protein n=1 Tax=Pseudomonas wadenswilerensis TaxID=1785161 RepID=A0A380T1B3_9PSED|nr:Lysine exporter protein (LYSE/YGGA) [Pseudomonas sp. JV241A]SUQ63745.1 LysE type translocator family protein [Pseudomonas wadenswilerensis]